MKMLSLWQSQQVYINMCQKTTNFMSHVNTDIIINTQTTTAAMETTIINCYPWQLKNPWDYNSNLWLVFCSDDSKKIKITLKIFGCCFKMQWHQWICKGRWRCYFPYDLVRIDISIYSFHTFRKARNSMRPGIRHRFATHPKKHEIFKYFLTCCCFVILMLYT